MAMRGRDRSVPKIVFGTIVLVICWVFTVMLFLLGVTGAMGVDEPSTGMVIVACAYALIMIIVGRWVPDNLSLVHSFFTGIFPGVLARMVGWPMLMDGLGPPITRERTMTKDEYKAKRRQERVERKKAES